MSTSLILRDDGARSVSILAEAHAAKESALEKAALIGTVGNASQKQAAVDAQTALYTLKHQVEKARKEAKEPILEFGKLIDETAKAFLTDVTDELTRVATEIGNFDQSELARQRAAEALRLKQLAEVERERQAALAAAQTLEQAEIVQEVYNRKVEREEAKPIAAPVKIEGQSIRTDIDFDVTDIHGLYAAHPNLVKLTEKRVEIKAALKAGMKIAGVRSFPVVKSSVRATKEPMAIDI